MDKCWNCDKKITWVNKRGKCSCEEIHYKCRKCEELDSETNCKGLFCFKCHDFYCNYCWQTNGVLIGPYDDSKYSDVEDGDYICEDCENN